LSLESQMAALEAAVTQLTTAIHAVAYQTVRDGELVMNAQPAVAKNTGNGGPGTPTSPPIPDDPVVEPAQEEEPQAPAPWAEDVKPVSVEQVQAALARFAADHSRDEAKALVTSFGVAKVHELTPEQRADLFARVS